ncbi:MAG TPA: preprotein translocase subunit YajC [Firmicutes bacterium]|nr:preprotein translocase subunit YajC [Bacillota bacterium]
MIAQVIPFLIVLLMFYFLLLRPQQIQQKRRQEMLSKLKRGDRILTVGGLYGEIVAMRDDVLTVRLADNVEVKMTKNGVSSVV